MIQKPKGMKSGDEIGASYLNKLRDYGIKSLRVGAGLFMHISGGRAEISLAPRPIPVNNTGPQSFIIARVTEVDSGDPLLVTAIEQAWSDADTDFIAAANGRTWDGESTNPPKVRIVDGQPRAVDDLVTLGHKFGPDNASQWFVVPEKAGAFGIKLTQTGGTAGDDTTQCSFTYTVDDMNDNEIATGVNPATGVHFAQRPTVGFRIAATAGVATYETGELVILMTNEIDDLEACS